jgi:hypothetical protein
MIRKDSFPIPRLAVLATLLMLFLAAASSAQDLPRKDHKPSLGTKELAKLLDTKGLEDRKAALAAAALLEKAYEGERPPEGVRMLIAILRGRMGPDEGWFGPAQTRYTWKWLAGRYGLDPKKGGIPRSRFRGPPAWFARLDRNKDGVITPDDLDWSERNPYLQMSKMSDMLFRRLNKQGNGQLTKQDLMEFFDKAAHGKDHLSPEEFRDALLAGMFRARQKSDMPKQAVLLRGLFNGEIGSLQEGPKLNAAAPDFTLKTADGKRSIQLKKLIGAKPVVLVFGSFT